MRWHVTVLLTILVISPVLFSQTPASNQPLQVKEGLWDVTVTKYLLPNVSEDELRQLTPQQREWYLAAIKDGEAHGETQTLAVCLSHEHLASGDVLGTNANCTKRQITSDGQKLEATLECENGQQTTDVERVSDTSFKGSQTLVTGGIVQSKVKSTFSATWTRADCSAVNPSAEAEQASESKGPDPDVVSLAPYVAYPNMGRLGLYLTYYWGARYPTFYYQGSPVRFHGTDGTYLYMTLPHRSSICVPPAKLLRADKAGQVTAVDRAPEGLHGGERPPDYCDRGKDQK